MYSGKHAPNFRDLTGQRFGKRVVVGFASVLVYNGRKGNSVWQVLCDCGKQSSVSSSTLRKSNSCGCDLELQKEAARRSGEARTSKVPPKVRANDGYRRRIYGLSKEGFEARILKQNNRCAICDDLFVITPRVDHKHACCPGRVTCGMCIRGLLCHLCNAGLGSFKDNPQVLLRAAEYLKAA